MLGFNDFYFWISESNDSFLILKYHQPRWLQSQRRRPSQHHLEGGIQWTRYGMVYSWRGLRNVGEHHHHVSNIKKALRCLPVWSSMWFGKMYQIASSNHFNHVPQQDFFLCVRRALVRLGAPDSRRQAHRPCAYVHLKQTQQESPESMGKSSTDHLCSIFIHFPNWLTSRTFQVTHRWLSIHFLMAPQRSECAARPAEVCPASSHGTCLDRWGFPPVRSGPGMLVIFRMMHMWHLQMTFACKYSSQVLTYCHSFLAKKKIVHPHAPSWPQSCHSHWKSAWGYPPPSLPSCQGPSTTRQWAPSD